MYFPRRATRIGTHAGARLLDFMTSFVVEVLVVRYNEMARNGKLKEAVIAAQ
jgi:hypothetical protein